jgi:hypothetical protein
VTVTSALAISAAVRFIRYSSFNWIDRERFADRRKLGSQDQT